MIINHGLGVYPVKVDVQILVTQGEVDYVFSATGAAQRDNDADYTFGGVVYIYNRYNVKIYLPNANQSGIAYSGTFLYFVESYLLHVHVPMSCYLIIHKMWPCLPI